MRTSSTKCPTRLAARSSWRAIRRRPIETEEDDEEEKEKKEKSRISRVLRVPSLGQPRRRSQRRPRLRCRWRPLSARPWECQSLHGRPSPSSIRSSRNSWAKRRVSCPLPSRRAKRRQPHLHRTQPRSRALVRPDRVRPRLVPCTPRTGSTCTSTRPSPNSHPRARAALTAPRPRQLPHPLPLPLRLRLGRARILQWTAHPSHLSRRRQPRLRPRLRCRPCRLRPVRPAPTSTRSWATFSTTSRVSSLCVVRRRRRPSSRRLTPVNWSSLSPFRSIRATTSRRCRLG